MHVNPWARFRSQRTLWVTLAVALGVLLLTVQVGASLMWVRGRVSAAEMTAFRTYLVAIAMVTEAVAIAVVWWATTSITRPLRQVVDVLDQVVRGDLTARLDIPNRDELGRMAAAFNVTTQALAGSLRTVSTDASTLASSARDMDEVSTRMADNARRGSEQAEAVASATSAVSESTREAATGAAGMATAIREIAVNVTDATRVADWAVRAAQTANATVARLGESSAEIGKVIKMITAIAGQTNLLALNATIEAARAGAAGKGFAVVANEVKDLAQETARATGDIARRVQAIQTDTTQAVDAITEIGSVIGQINAFQTTIAAAVEEQTAAAGIVTASVSDAAERTAYISTGLEDTARYAQETRTASRSMRDSAEGLSEMASRLAEVAGRYRTG
jgi:methyl-accepting chemotaxis protein